jgi:hypothetical protein
MQVHVNIVELPYGHSFRVLQALIFHCIQQQPMEFDEKRIELIVYRVLMSLIVSCNGIICLSFITHWLISSIINPKNMFCVK